MQKHKTTKLVPTQMKQDKIPLLGMGTWRLQGEECKKILSKALEMGYRHIDTADIYQNHKEIGLAIKTWPREDIFLTSKLFLNDLSPAKVQEAVSRFLEELNTHYLDLLLIHWPTPEMNLVDTLQAMLAAKDKGLVRNIGVSNFVRSHLNALAPYHFPLFTNQIEMHPYLQRKELVQACRKMNIIITAYRPLAKGAFESDAVLQTIGRKYHKSPSQVALRWLTQQGIHAIPKASTDKHLKDNMDIFDFDLDKTDLHQIEQLNRHQRFCTPEGFPIYED
jgi:2,5-diketo-D-gluconate reductase B